MNDLLFRGAVRITTPTLSTGGPNRRERQSEPVHGPGGPFYVRFNGHWTDERTGIERRVASYRFVIDNITLVRDYETFYSRDGGA